MKSSAERKFTGLRATGYPCYQAVLWTPSDFRFFGQGFRMLKFELKLDQQMEVSLFSLVMREFPNHPSHGWPYQYWNPWGPRLMASARGAPRDVQLTLGATFDNSETWFQLWTGRTSQLAHSMNQGKTWVTTTCSELELFKYYIPIYTQ